MRIVVDRMPDSPRDCLFSKYKKAGCHVGYICSLHEYIPEADEYGDGYKCGCVCRDVSKCPHLVLDYF